MIKMLLQLALLLASLLLGLYGIYLGIEGEYLKGTYFVVVAIWLEPSNWS